MSNFLSTELLNAKRFALGGSSEEDADPAESRAESQSADSDPAAATDALRDCVRREEKAAEQQAFRATKEELVRQRSEMLFQLEERMRQLEHDQDRISAGMETTRVLKEALEMAPQQLDENEPHRLRELRRAVEAARIELAQAARRDAERLGTDGGGMQKALAALPFRRVLRIGFAFALPLIAGLVLAALIVAYALVSTFGV